MDMEDWECIPPLVDGKRYSFTDVYCKQGLWSISSSMIAKIGRTRDVDITLGTEYDGTPFVVCYLTTYPFQLLKVSDSTSDANPGDTNIALIIVIVVVILLLFGSKRIPELARSLGRASYEFKKAKNDISRESRELLAEAEKQAEAEDQSREKVPTRDDSESKNA